MLEEFAKQATISVDYDHLEALQAMMALLGIQTNPENATVRAVEDLKHIPETVVKKVRSLINLVHNPKLKGRVNLQHFEPIFDELDKIFNGLIDEYMAELSHFGKKSQSVQNYQNKKQYLEKAPLYLFVKEVIQLFNYTDTQLTKLGFESRPELYPSILNCVDGWLQDVEDLGKSPLHELLLSYLVKINNFIAEDYVRLGLKQRNDLNPSAGVQLRKAAQLGHLCLQYSEDLVKTYKRDREDLSMIASTLLIWGYAYEGFFKQARPYIKSLVEIFKTKEMLMCHHIEPIIYYADCLANSEHADPQEAYLWLREATDLFAHKSIGIEAESNARYYQLRQETQALLNQQKIRFDQHLKERLWKAYQNFTLERDVLSIQLYPAAITEFARTSPSWQPILEKEGANVKLSKNAIQIHDIHKVRTKDLDGFLQRIQAFQRQGLNIIVRQALQPSKLKRKSTKASGAELKAEYPLEVLDPEVPKEGPRQEEELKPNPIPLLEALELNESSEEDESISSSSSEAVEQPEALKLGFADKAFHGAHFTQLEGAKGIYVAYQPQQALDNANNIDKVLESKYKSLLENPLKARPKKQNGFKWGLQNKEPVLIGKVTRSPIRMFPVARAVNPKGETAFLYGELRNTKKGKKKNRYQ